MTKGPETHQQQDWLTRPIRRREHNRIILVEDLIDVLDIAKASGVSIYVLQTEGQPYDAAFLFQLFKPTDDQQKIGYTGKGMMNEGAVPEDSVFAKFKAEKPDQLQKFWDKVRAKKQEEEAEKTKTK